VQMVVQNSSAISLVKIYRNFDSASSVPTESTFKLSFCGEEMCSWHKGYFFLIALFQIVDR